METDSIMLKALALSARRGGALIVSSAGAPTATEPGACSSPRLPPGVPRECCRQCPRARPARPWLLETLKSCGLTLPERRRDLRDRDRVVPWADDPTRIASSKRPPPPARQTRPASTEYVAQLAKAPAFTERLQRPPRRRRRPRFTRAVGVHGSANHGVATPAPPLATGPPHYHHITTTRTTPAHTHPYRTHLHLDCTHHAVTSPPATRSPLPLQCPCPS